MCTDTLVYCEQTVREEDAARAYGYTGVLWANSQRGGCGACGRVHRRSVGKQSERRMRRVRTGAPVFCGQTVREAAGGPGRECGERVRVNRCIMSKQSGNEWPGQGEDAASVYGYTDTPVHYE